MNHFTVLQHGDDGPFHYVSVNKRGGHPTQGCTPDCAHDTADEAWEHHRQWVLDNIRVHDEPDVQRECEACGAWTTRRVEAGNEFATTVLCDAHDDRAELEQRYAPPGSHLEAWGSY